MVRGEVSNDATVAVVWPNGDDQMVYARDLEIDSRLTVIAYQKMSGDQHEIWWGLTFAEATELIGRKVAESVRFSWTFLVFFGAEEPRNLCEFTTLQRCVEQVASRIRRERRERSERVLAEVSAKNNADQHVKSREEILAQAAARFAAAKTRCIAEGTDYEVDYEFRDAREALQDAVMNLQCAGEGVEGVAALVQEGQEVESREVASSSHRREAALREGTAQRDGVGDRR